MNLKNSSVGIFADGTVGAQIVSFLLDADPKNISFICIIEKDGNPVWDVLQLKSFNADKIIFHKDLSSEKMQSLKVDVGFLCWWPYIVKEDTLAVAERFVVNTHPSYLPFCRGKDPNFWAIAHQEPFGVTLHTVNLKIDAGDILAQREIPVTWQDNGKTLYEQSLKEMVSLFKKTYFPIINGELTPKKQPDGGSFHYRKELEAASEIDLDKTYSGRELLNLLRARTFKPHPAAWFEDGGKRYNVTVEITEDD
ncbi:formyltransferase family protein [Terasakiella pusilla]|uniref:formyltransferase family protein n=1 Tax=Terasakiella pusilla TaxID=64973 RepID=UPI003AA8F662